MNSLSTVLSENAAMVSLSAPSVDYDHQTFTAIAVVGYHRTNTIIAVFYNVLGGRVILGADS